MELHLGVEASPGPLTWGDGVRLSTDETWYISRDGIAASDIDANGVADIVIAGYDEVAVLFGNGDGSFGESLRLPTAASELDAVHVVELTGDSFPEVLVTSSYGGGAVFENPGDRTTSESFGLPALGSSLPPFASVGDFDAKPGLEILLADIDNQNARLLAFEATTTAWVELPLGRVALDLLLARAVVADIDGDGRDEVLSALGLPIYCE